MAKSKVMTKVKKVMHEFKEKTLKSSSGKPVTKRKQAIAIALSEQREMEKRKRSKSKTKKA